MREGAEKAEPRFVAALQYPDFESRMLAHEIQKRGPIGRFPNGAGGDDLGALGALLFRERGHPAQRRERVLYRYFAQGPRPVETGAQPWRRTHLVNDADVSTRRYVGDDLPNGVRADVDRGYSYFLSRLIPGGGRAERQPDWR